MSATVAFRDLVCAALDAGGHASSSPVGVAALDMAPDVSSVVQYAGSYAAYYRMTWRREPCPQIAAVNVVLLAETETSRGVRRVVMKAKGRP